MDQNNQTNQTKEAVERAPAAIEAFLSTYVSQPKFNELSEVEKANMFQMLIKNYNERITLAIVTYCPDERKAELTELIKENNQEKIDTFFETYMPTMPNIMFQETQDFIKDLIS